MKETENLSAATGDKPTYAERWWEANARPLAWIILTGTLVCHLLIVWINRNSIANGSYDFVAFYSAARVVMSGRGASLYSVETQQEFQQAFPSFRQNPLLFNHPPYELPMVLPLALFSYPTAYLLWTGLNVAALFIVLFMLFPCLQNLQRSLSPALVAMLLFSFFPVLIVLVQGQDSILYLLVYVLTFVNLRRGNDHRAGLFAALAMFRFQLMIPLLLAFAIRKRWKVLSGFLLGSTGLGIISVLVTGWRGVLDYIELLLRINQAARDNPANKATFYIHPEAMPNLRGFFDAHLAGKIPDHYVVVLIAGLSALLLIWSLSKGVGGRFEGTTDADLPFSLHTVVILLISYHMHLHDVSVLLVPLLLVANHLASAPYEPSPSRLVLIFMVVALFLSPTYFIPTQIQQLNWLALPIAVFALLVGTEISRQRSPISGGDRARLHSRASTT